MPKPLRVVCSPNLEWIFFGEDAHNVYSLTRDGLSHTSKPSLPVNSKENTKNEQASTTSNIVELAWQDRSAPMYGYSYNWDHIGNDSGTVIAKCISVLVADTLS